MGSSNKLFFVRDKGCVLHETHTKIGVHSEKGSQTVHSQTDLATAMIPRHHYTYKLTHWDAWNFMILSDHRPVST